MVVWSYGKESIHSAHPCHTVFINMSWLLYESYAREPEERKTAECVCECVASMPCGFRICQTNDSVFIVYDGGRGGGLFSSVCAPLNQMAYGKPSSGVAQQRRRRQSMAKSYILSHTPCANDANRTLPSKRKQTPVSIVRDSLRVIARVCVCARLISLRLRFSSFGMAVVLCCTYGLVALWCIMLPFRRRE